MCAEWNGLIQKDKQIINLGDRSFGPWVLYFGYSPREELRLLCLHNSMGTPAELAASPKRLTSGD